MEALFLRLVNISVTASYLIVAVMLLRLLLRRAPRWLLCALWALVALRLACPVSLESRWSLIPTATPVTAETLSLEGITLPRRASGQEAAEEESFSLEEDGPAAAAQSGGDTSAAPAGTVDSQTASPKRSLAYWASAVWLAGAAAILLYGLLSYLLLRRRLATAVRQWGNLWQSEAVTSPFVLGLLRPNIYLPFHLDSQTARYVIAHERAHIQRRDHLTKPFGFLLLAVYWFNPLVWAAYALLCRDIELACDERVIRNMSAGARRDYAMALLSCGMKRRLLPACPLTFAEVSVKERIKSVMTYKKPAFWLICLCLIAFATAAVFLLTNPVADAAEESEPLTESVPGEEAAALSAATVQDGDGSLLLPETPEEPVPVLEIAPDIFTAARAKAIVEAIFGGATIYEYSEQYTKNELSQLIESWEARLSDREALLEDFSYDEEFVDSYIQEFQPYLESLKAEYETAPDALEPKLCDWQWHTSSYYMDGADAEQFTHDEISNQEIIAVAALDGTDYNIWISTRDEDDFRLSMMYIYPQDDPLFAERTSDTVPTEDDLKALVAYSQSLLTCAGLDNYVIDSYYIGYGNLVTITALPVYEGYPVAYSAMSGSAINSTLPNTYAGTNYYEETITFTYLDGQLLEIKYQSPQKVMAIQDSDYEMLTAAEAAAIAVEGLEQRDPNSEMADMYALYDTGGTAIDEVQLAYARLPIGDGTENFLLVPVWCFYATAHVTSKGTVTDSPVSSLKAVVSAMDGSLLYLASI